MRNRITSIFLALALALPAVAHGQAWTVGDQGVNWNVLSTKPPNAAAPADAYEAPDPGLPAGVTESDWLVSTGDQLTSTRGSGNFYVNSTDGERKIRTTCEPATVKQKDNILAFGQAVSTHAHQGYGSVTWDENTTYATLRADPVSTCAGALLNASNYMEPAMLTTLSSGLKVAVRAQDQANYYVEGVQSDPNEDTWLWDEVHSRRESRRLQRSDAQGYLCCRRLRLSRRSERAARRHQWLVLRRRRSDANSH